jgi:hypothetical protein
VCAVATVQYMLLHQPTVLMTIVSSLLILFGKTVTMSVSRYSETTAVRDPKRKTIRILKSTKRWKSQLHRIILCMLCGTTSEGCR